MRSPPAEQDPTFRRLLPCAVAFGFAPWLAGAFAPLVGAWSDPSTYYHQIGTFTTDVHSAGTPPSSSWSSGGGSGFSGGSSGGGGGGGGGGGSW